MTGTAASGTDRAAGYDTAGLAALASGSSAEVAAFDLASEAVAAARNVEAESAGGRSWHVARNVGESERRVRECLRRASYEIYFPLIRELRPVPKRELSRARRASGLPIMREALVPLFPRYLFIRFSLHDRRWREVFSTLGLRGLLGDDREPIPRPFPETIIRALQASEIDGALPGRMTARELAWQVGERVRIGAGPLAGHAGIIDRLPDRRLGELDGMAKLKLLVALFGRETMVELPLAAIVTSGP